MITDKNVENYCIEYSSTPSQLCRDLQAYTREHFFNHHMMIGELEASFLSFLIKSNGVKNILELGTYTGYSALAMAEALPLEGKIITIDINEETNNVAKKFWIESNHAHKIHSIIGQALIEIPKIQIQFDMVFIDADKANYIAYLDQLLPRLSPNGFIVVDNVLWKGEVVEADKTDKILTHIRRFNDYLLNHKGVERVLLPIRDGIFLIRNIAK